MRVVHLDASHGATGPTLLGALLDAGGSLEAVEAAVESLGVGNVRITLGRVRRGDALATSIRIRAPEGTPSVGSWDRLRHLVAYAALEEPVRRRCVACVDRLQEAASQVRGVASDQLRLRELPALDVVTETVAVGAALASLGPDRVTCGPVGVGGGGASAGGEALPGPVVGVLLGDWPVQRRAGRAGGTDPIGAALVAVSTEPVSRRPAMTVEREGLGATAGGRRSDGVLRAYVGVVTGRGPAGTP